MTQKQADYGRARAMYPEIDSLDARGWEAFFAESPDALHHLLGEIYIITKTQQAEVKRSGRRVRTVNGNLDELWAMITPRYSMDPFGVAVRDLMGPTSLRAFAAKIPMHHHSLTRLMRGERQIVNPFDIPGSMRTLEVVAKAGRAHPAFFVEWRELLVLGVVRKALSTDPALSIRVIERLEAV